MTKMELNDRYAESILGDRVSHYDTLEIQGGRNLNEPDSPDGTCCEIDNINPEFFSVYARLKVGGIESVGDFANHQLASNYASTLSQQFSLAVNDCVSEHLRLLSTQTMQDQNSLRAITRRGGSLLSEVKPLLVTADVVRADLAEFAKISDVSYKRFAAVQISDNVSASIEYNAHFSNVLAEYPGVADNIVNLLLVENALSSAKAIRKAAEFVSIQSDPELQRSIADHDRHSQATPAIATTTGKLMKATGTHIGRVTAIDGNHISQKIGRDPDTVVWHDMVNLRGPVPKVGEMVEIGYANGVGIVKETALAQGIGH